MTTLRYLHLDVFTNRALEGNQLAVFPEPGNIDTAMMQAITREMNFSECTFMFPPAGSGDIKMRIFTPGEELPMAGHPTVGSTFALAAEGTIPQACTDFVFELGVGPTPVSLEWRDGQLSFVWMTQPLPKFGGVIADRGALATALGLGAVDLAPDVPAQVVSCGNPFIFVRLATRTAVDAVTVDRRAFTRCCKDAGLDALPTFFFTTDGTPEAGAAQTIYSRMLAPTFGIAEDPATGSACGPLGCYLLHYGIVSADGARNVLNLQGVQMKRPSRIYIAIDNKDGEITRVRVGGQSVIVGRGELVIA